MRFVRLVLMAGVLCSSAAADQIMIDNGDRLTGKIVTADEKTVILQTKYAGELKVDRSTVVRIESDDMLNVTVKDAGTLKAKVDAVPTSTNITRADGITTTVKPDAVTAIRSDAAQAAYEREVERMTRPRLNDFWAGFVFVRSRELRRELLHDCGQYCRLRGSECRKEQNSPQLRADIREPENDGAFWANSRIRSAGLSGSIAT